MQIGITTSVTTKSKYWQRINDFIELGFCHIEIYNKATRIRLSDIDPLRKLKKENKLSFSFHSMSQDLFCKDKIIANAELAFIKGEIRLASLIGCNNFIFHLNVSKSLNLQELKQLTTLSNLAKKSGIKLCLENNFSTSFSNHNLVKLVGNIKDLYCCLDIGHLNVALGRGFIKDKEKFINSIRDKIVQLHISFNDGQKDQHREPRMGDKKYLNEIIEIIGNPDLLAIIETRDIGQAIKTRKLMEKYI